MLNMRKNPRICILLVFIIANLIAPTAICERYVRPGNVFELSYPDSFTLVNVPIPNVALALRSTLDSFPTLNVLDMPGTYGNSTDNLESLKDKVLNDYKLIGLMDAKAISYKTREVNGRPCLEIALSYSQDKINFISNVNIFSSPSRHFILTFVDTAEHFPASAAIAHDIVESFKIDPSIPATEPISPKSTNSAWLYTCLALAALAAIAWRHWRPPTF